MIDLLGDSMLHFACWIDGMWALWCWKRSLDIALEKAQLQQSF